MNARAASFRYKMRRDLRFRLLTAMLVCVLPIGIVSCVLFGMVLVRTGRELRTTNQTRLNEAMSYWERDCRTVERAMDYYVSVNMEELNYDHLSWSDVTRYHMFSQLETILPEAAMKFLNMMFSDGRVVNLLSWGIQGKDYTLDENEVPSPMEGRSYVNPLGMYGDQRLRYEPFGEEQKAAQAAFSAKAERVFPQYDSFCFDTSRLVQELLEIERVESQYVKLLEAGCVDLDTVYPESIQKLYDAGLQRVIDEKQRQLDAFLAAMEEE